MLLPAQGCDETMVHVCPQGRGKPKVFIHDVFVYMFIVGKQVRIKYCPYCGVDVENYEYSN